MERQGQLRASRPSLFSFLWVLKRIPGVTLDASAIFGMQNCSARHKD